MSAVKISLDLKNELAELASLAESVEEFCESHDLAPKNNFELTLVLDEIFTNIISYGFTDEKEHRIKIDISKENNLIVIRVEDDGIPFDPTKVKKKKPACSLEDCRIGGLGLHVINRIMSSVVYERKSDKNILILKKRLANC